MLESFEEVSSESQDVQQRNEIFMFVKPWIQTHNEKFTQSDILLKLAKLR